MGVENIKYYYELRAGIVKPNSRLNKIADDLRKIADDLEAGKEVNPKKLKKLAGSLDYWNEKFLRAALHLLDKPVEVIRARAAWREKQDQSKVEPDQAQVQANIFPMQPYL